MIHNRRLIECRLPPPFCPDPGILAKPSSPKVGIVVGWGGGGGRDSAPALPSSADRFSDLSASVSGLSRASPLLPFPLLRTPPFASLPSAHPPVCGPAGSVSTRFRSHTPSPPTPPPNPIPPAGGAPRTSCLPRVLVLGRSVAAVAAARLGCPAAAGPSALNRGAYAGALAGAGARERAQSKGPRERVAAEREADARQRPADPNRPLQPRAAPWGSRFDA